MEGENEKNGRTLERLWARSSTAPVRLRKPRISKDLDPAASSPARFGLINGTRVNPDRFPGTERPSLTSLASACPQLLDLFLQWDWSTYLADYGKPTCKYLRVNPHTALALLEKMRESNRKNNMFAQFRKTDRDRQKLMDTVIKQLRNLIAQHHA
ncbi:Exocyst complex component 6B [Takifugu flavidus]|uniref:Exocyst complex component 6B n=1 Tax=Takifugu flavidus TaxID=433684 RepID=A0A5C6N7W4_9TELE|nr:Exocyst complex component 6B [Takifugu flavidus]